MSRVTSRPDRLRVQEASWILQLTEDIFLVSAFTPGISTNRRTIRPHITPVKLLTFFLMIFVMNTYHGAKILIIVNISQACDVIKVFITSHPFQEDTGYSSLESGTPLYLYLRFLLFGYLFLFRVQCPVTRICSFIPGYFVSLLLY